MTPVLSAAEMRAADAQAVASTGDAALMRNAGARIAEWIAQTFPGGGRIVAFAGPGNNGGDAFAALAALQGSYERVIYAAAASSPTDARRDAEARAREAGIEVRPLPAGDDDARAALDGAVLAVDALFGTGARLPLAQPFRAAARAMHRDRLPVLAVDIPSGIDADSGARDQDAVVATATLALAALKPGLLLEPATECCGDLWVGEIGIGDDVLRAHAQTFDALDDDAFRALLPKRPANADKRSSGAPLVIAGSGQFPGAAVLCALGAARAGAGYVTVVTPEAAAPILRAHLIEQVVVTLPDTSAEEAASDLLEIVKKNSAVAIGPGLGLDERTGSFIRAFVRELNLPFVLDASALFHFGKHLEILEGKPCVLTPHAGEFARLSGKGTIAPGTRVERLREFVDRTGATTLLKGNDTLIYDGKIVHVNTTGTNALATAGTGDVLTGIIATLLSQGLSPADAARAGAYWHGLAGSVAAHERPVGVIAGDIPNALAAALPPPMLPEVRAVRLRRVR